MKKIMLLTIALMVSATSFAGSVTRFNDVNDVDCYKKITRIKCDSSGYWTGENDTSCYAKIQYKKFDSDRFVIEKITGYGAAHTDTGVAAELTLGLTDAVANQFNALGSRADAKSAVRSVIKEVKMFTSKCKK